MTEEQNPLNANSIEFDCEKVRSYWLIEANEALTVADHLMEKADYSYALFFGHLAIEKILKAIYAERLKGHAPPTHNLIRLAKTIRLELDEQQAEDLITITAFNIEARYPDLKRSFRQTCTPEYAAQHMTTIKDMFQWLLYRIR